MATQHNFRIKNGLEVAGTVRITSAGLITGTTTTQAASDNTTKLASTAYVTTALANLSDSAPSTLNTLNELAAALGDDANYATTTTNAIAAKLPLAGGTLTGDLLIPGKIRHAGDTDTYISFANNDDFRVVVGNSTRAAFNTSKIHFNQEGINQDFQVEGANVENLLYVDASADKVGIGTTTPLGKLHVRDGSAQAGISHTYIYDGTAINVEATEPAIQLMAEDSGTHGGSLLWRYGNNAFAAIANPTTDAIDFTYGVTTNNDFQVHSGTNMSSYLKIMSIGADGKVGMGVSPATNAKLTLGGTTASYSSVLAFDNNTTGGATFFMLASDNTWNAGGNKFFMGHGAPSSAAVDITIDADGKVGIGNTAPAQMLSVNSSSGSGVCPGRFTAGGNTNTLEVWGNSTASTSTGLLCNAGTNENDYSAKFRNYAGSTIMEVRGDSVIDIFGTTRLQDSTILALGQSSDTRIYYDGSDSLYITATNGTANAIKTSANNTYIMQANGNQLITAIANSEVVINNDSSASVDFRVESDNEQYNFFCDASSEIIHFGEGTNTDLLSVIPAGVLHGRRHGYHGGQRQHSGQTFKFSEGTSWTDALKIDWNNPSWGAVCMRITGMYYYNASDNFSIVIGFQGYSGHGSVSYDATSSGVMNWTTALQLAQTATGETTIRQRAGDSTGDIIYRYEWQCYARSDQEIDIIDL